MAWQHTTLHYNNLMNTSGQINETIYKKTMHIKTHTWFSLVLQCGRAKAAFHMLILPRLTSDKESKITSVHSSFIASGFNVKYDPFQKHFQELWWWWRGEASCQYILFSLLHGCGHFQVYYMTYKGSQLFVWLPSLDSSTESPQYHTLSPECNLFFEVTESYTGSASITHRDSNSEQARGVWWKWWC